MIDWISRYANYGLNILNPQAGAALSRARSAQASAGEVQRAAAAGASAGASAPSFQAGSYARVPPAAPNTTAQEPPTPSYENIEDAQGRRVRLRAKPAGAARVYGDGIMKPLLQTKGMVFPYQPLITYQQEVTYDNMQLVHTNQDIYSYTRTPALKLTVSGDFTVQNQQEGLYSLACIHFLRTATKMWFGGEGNEEVVANQGTPPPVLLFDAYGQYMFNALPVVITQFSVSLPQDVDYVPILYSTSSNVERKTVQSVNSSSLKSGTQDGYAWLPAVFKIDVQLTVQNTPQKLRKFNMASFRSGALLRDGGWV